MKPPTLRHELHELALISAGAIPGALLRWQLEGAASGWIGGLKGVIEADFVANMAGCLVVGMLLARPKPSARVMLWGVIGFCGALTTFSSWMLGLARAIDRGQGLPVLLISLIGGLLLLNLGIWLGRQWFTPPADSPGSSPSTDPANRAGR